MMGETFQAIVEVGPALSERKRFDRVPNRVRISRLQEAARNFRVISESACFNDFAVHVF
jgi:hypothetical protein